MSKDKVLLVIDLQPEFADKGKENYLKLLEYIESHRREYAYIVATMFLKGNPNYPKRLNWDFTDKPQPLEFDANVILKKYGYGLLEHQYKWLDKKAHYDIIGCETDACVLKIAMDLFDREFNFNILPNYIYTNGDDNEAAIRILKRNVGLSED